MEILLKAHDGMRWLVLLGLLVAIANAKYKWFFKKDFTKSDNIINLFTFIFTDIQFLIGLILYFVNGRYQGFSNMGDSMQRFYALEHPLLMLIAIALIHIGRAKMKKAADDRKKHFFIVMFYGVALVLIFVSIPWPWRLAM